MNESSSNPDAILVIDQGTHASRAIVFDADGEILAQQHHAIELLRLSDTHIEQQGEQILSSIQSVVTRLPTPLLSRCSVAALTTQRSTTLAFSRSSGTPLHAAISWQDRRTEGQLANYAEHASRVREITGLPLSPHYSAGKIQWLVTNSEAVKQAVADDDCCIAPLAAWLMNRLLTGHPVNIDHSNAHRSLLFDLQTRDWSAELLALFNINRQLLPACRPVVADHGMLAHYDIPLKVCCGDQNAAFYGMGDANETAMINLGSGAFILAALPYSQATNDLLCSIGANHDDHQDYLLEGTVNGAGLALDWLSQSMPVDGMFDQLPAWLEQVQSPPVFINAVGGTGSPDWLGELASFFVSEPQDIASAYVAVVESIVFALVRNLEIIQQLQPVSQLRVSGGLAQLDGLCQKLADLSGCRVERTQISEATARGAAWLAAGCPGHWFSENTMNCFLPRDPAALRDRYQIFGDQLCSLRQTDYT